MSTYFPNIPKPIQYYLKNQDPHSLLTSLDNTLQYIFYRYSLIFKDLSQNQIKSWQMRILCWFVQNGQKIRDYLSNIKENSLGTNEDNVTSTPQTSNLTDFEKDEIYYVINLPDSQKLKKINQINGCIGIINTILRAQWKEEVCKE